jgi:serine/threonine protein kinase
MAIKTLLQDFRANRSHIALLKWEYGVGSQLRHERVIEIVEYGTSRGTAYLAMEWFAAPNMKMVIRQGLDKIGYLVPKIAAEATEALAYVGSQGWVHRDIKPDNFLVAEDGTVKLIDFALARRSKTGFWAKLFTPRTKVQQGTRSYMSPEQIRGLPLDTRADLYSLACTLFELVGGKPPFTGISERDLLVKHLKAAPPPLLVYNKNVTNEFADLIRRAMAKEPSARFDSVADFLGELKRTRIFRRDPAPPEQVRDTGT